MEDGFKIEYNYEHMILLESVLIVNNCHIINIQNNVLHHLYLQNL